MTDAERPGAIAYVRSGRPAVTIGAAEQRRGLRAWSERAAVPIRHWFVEKRTAGPVEERPELLLALACLGSAARVLCITRPEVLHEDSWVRSIVERVAVQAGGSVTYAAPGLQGPPGQLDFDQALGVHERLLLRLQVARAAELKKPRDAVWGRCPWGYRLSADGMHLEPNPAERAVGTAIKHMRLRGLKLRQIRDELIALGVVGRTGKPLGLTQIYYLLDEGQGSRPHVLAERSVEEDDAPPSSVVRPSAWPNADVAPPIKRTRRRGTGE